MTVHCYLGSCQPSQASSDMTSRQNRENWLWSLPRVCLSHMPNPAGASLHRHVHNKSSALFRWEVEQLGAADRTRKWRVTSAAEVTWSCLQHPNPSSALITTNSLDIFVSSTFETPLFHQEIFVFCLFHFCICLVLDHTWTSPGFPRTSYWEVRQIKSGETTEHLTLTSAFTHAPPPGKTWRSRGVHRMSERMLSQHHDAPPSCSTLTEGDIDPLTD